MLSAVIPQADYAEDQKAAKFVLTAHVIYRGVQTGAVVGLGFGLLQAIVLRRRAVQGDLIRQAIVRSTGVGVAIGTGLMVIGLPFHMRGREEIEWNDRSYRLLANKYQEQVDDWTLPTTIIGLGTVLAAGNVQGPGAWKLLAGGAGLGSLTGLGALMIYRLAVQRRSIDVIKPSGPSKR